MSTISLACAFVVAGVFVVAAVAKLRSPAATGEATIALGVPAVAASFVAPVELGVAMMLLFVPAAGAAAATGLLAVFTVLLRRALATGRTVRCGCFGAGSSTPVTSVSLLRNGGLIAASLLAWPAPSVLTIDAVERLASLMVGLGVVSIGLLIHALAELRLVTGSVFPTSRSDV